MRESAPWGQGQPELQESTNTSQELVNGPSSAEVPLAFESETYVLEPLSSFGRGSDSGAFANYLVAVFQHRWMILSICAVAMLATFLYSKYQKPMFQATATFMVAGSRAMHTRGASLDRIFSSHPLFLVEHALTPELLDPLLLESFHAPGEDAPMAFLDYLGIQGDSLSERLYLGRSLLARSIEVSIPNRLLPFFLSIDVSLDDPEMASQIANRLVERLAEVDVLRQGKASKEQTSLIEIQAEAVELDLRAAEETLEKFLDANRLMSTARLAGQKRRLEREVELQSGLFIELRTRLAVSRLTEDQGFSAVSIVERAYPPREPYTLLAGTDIALAGLAGLLLALALTSGRVSWKRSRLLTERIDWLPPPGTA